MKANELRIGNYVDVINRSNEVHLPMNIVAEVGEIHLFKVLLHNPKIPIIRRELTEYTNISDLSPIKITERWLIKLGFHISAGVYIIQLDDDKRFLRGYITEKGFFCYLDEYDFLDEKETFALRNIKYVHQLQNLFFALTGEELKVK